MTFPAPSQRKVRPALLPVATAALAIGIFVVDRLTPVSVAISGLYVAIVLLATRFLRPRGVLLVAAGCVVLTLGNLIGRPGDTLAEGFVNALSSLGAIAVTTFLVLQGQRSDVRLRDQASLLDLTHDTIFVRGMDDVITYWNRGAEQLYGWPAEEAVGQVSHQLMQTTFPAPLEEINAELLRTGRWEGELVHTKRDAMRVTVSSRWSLQRDREGRPARILETNNDVTERNQAQYLTGQVFESSPDWMSIVGRDYRYQRVNPALARFWRMPVERIGGKQVADLMGRERFEETSKPNLDRCFAGEEVTFSGWIPSPGSRHGRFYLAVSYSPLRPHSEQVEAALVITRDLTDHMLASEALRAAQADLAHVNRVATMGQLTASIAHEVNQPIAASVINAQAAMRWLGTDPPNLDEVREALGRAIDSARRAGDVISRIRAAVAKAPPRKSRFDFNEAVSDVIALTRSEARKHGVSVQARLAADLPSVEGDRVQLQQVILNLIMNAIEAMSGVDDGARELWLSTATDDEGCVRLAVRDSGPGLDPQSAARLFEAFYTTKPEGMGMGLAICRSIVEAHGGRLWASANEPRGAVFQLTLPLEQAEAAPAEQARQMPG
ncbi:PAS domain-containing sensor histidine kinase [Phenylobacterium sp.]|jgi:PAS domain S-box-containing protein|uniref:PAS domain-containing sensor histidine kinase n=1 Tax=Phenylobacterium sp. TaxID=1871053 RepID=UPI002E361976|nr:ATP-binding protein [Phenylobacterium sp.]HEX4709480.1 ATP-binding protein [Phenylobacterium sp.]